MFLEYQNILLEYLYKIYIQTILISYDKNNNIYIEYFHILNPILNKILQLTQGDQNIIDKYSNLIISFIKCLNQLFLPEILNLCNNIKEEFSLYPSSGLLLIFKTIIKYYGKINELFNVLQDLLNTFSNIIILKYNNLDICIDNPDIIDV